MNVNTVAHTTGVDLYRTRSGVTVKLNTTTISLPTDTVYFAASLNFGCQGTANFGATTLVNTGTGAAAY
jgi:hypothetical protein